MNPSILLFIAVDFRMKPAPSPSIADRMRLLFPEPEEHDRTPSAAGRIDPACLEEMYEEPERWDGLS